MAELEDLRGRKLGEFILRERLGEGGFGAVYRCEQRTLRREAVVKILHPRLRRNDIVLQRFLREAQVATRLDHPYAAHVYAFGVEHDDGLCWIAMELVQGTALNRWLSERGPLPLDQFLPFFERVAEVVHTAHERGIVHRDLKPSNIMVIERSGRLLPKLLDFGIAKLIDDAAADAASQPSPGPVDREDRCTVATEPPAQPAVDLATRTANTLQSSDPDALARLTLPGSMIGSPPYMSPEQWGNAVTVRPASDLYSLAVVAYESLTGRHPFKADTLAGYAELHSRAAVPALGDGFPSTLDRFFARALAKRPEDRWNNALELAAALRVASAPSDTLTDLPRLDPRARDAWLAGAPQPLAESIAELEAAHHPHQARDAVHELTRTVLRYLLVLALVTRTRVQDEHEAPDLLDSLRAMQQRELGAHERVHLLRLLLRSMLARRADHPIPELLDLATLDGDRSNTLDSIVALLTDSEHAGSDEIVRRQLAQCMPALSQILIQLSFVLDYPLAVQSGTGVEVWAGLRHLRQRREEPLPRDGTRQHPTLLDRENRPILDLWPLVQLAPVTEADAPELFLFDGRGRDTARLIASPAGLVRDDPDVSSWLAARIIAPFEAKVRMHEQLRSSAQQWLDRARPAGLLWRGGALADLERWTRDASASGLSDTETAFVRASQRYARRARWIRRMLAGIGVLVIAVAIKYRFGQAVAEIGVTQAELEQGRQALLHGDAAGAAVHLERAYQRGERSPATEFMLARALQPRAAELARLSAVSGRMWSAEFSADGKRILTSDDQSAQIWDAQTYRLMHALAHSDNVYEARFTPDGEHVVTASRDGDVQIWDTETGKRSRDLALAHTTSHVFRYYRLALSRDGKFVAGMDEQASAAHVWDFETGRLLADLPNIGTRSPIVAFSADGRWFATSGGRDVRVFDTTTWTRAMTLTDMPAFCLSFSPTAPLLAVGAANGDAAVWSVPGGQRIHHLHDIGEPVDAIAFSPDGEFVATGGHDGSEQVWNVQSGTLRSQLNELRSEIRSIEFDPASKLLVAAGTNRTVLVSDPRFGAPITMLDGPRNTVAVAHFDPSSHRVIAAAWDGTARIWQVASPYKRWSSAPVAENCGVLASVVTDGRFLAATCHGFETRVWDTANDRLLAVLPAVIDVGDDYSAFAAATTEGDRAAIARGSAVEIFEVPGGKLLRTIVHPAAISSVAFASHGHDMISGSIDGTVLVTRDEAQAPLTLPMAHAAIDVVGFLPDGRTIDADASRNLRIFARNGTSPLAELQAQGRSLLFRPSSDGRYLITLPTFRRSTPPELWDLTRYTATAQLAGHVGPVRSARFVRGDREILTAGGDGSVKLWEASTGRLLSTYEGGVRWLADAVLDPSDTMVVAGGGEGVVRFWDAATARPLWTLSANTPYIGGLHYEGPDLVTRGFRGDIIRWSFPDPRRVIEACTAQPIAAGNRPGCSALE